MNSKKNIFYSLANKIRTKLLLFIDNEIIQKSSKTNTKNSFNEELIELSFEETFSEKTKDKICSTIYVPKIDAPSISHTPCKTEEIFINDNYNTPDFNFHHQFHKKVIKNKKEKSSFIRSVSNNKNKSNFKNNECIVFNDKKYIIRKNIKQSSAFLIQKKKEEKFEKDGIFLKNLCRNFKKECCKIKITVCGCDNTEPINNNININIENNNMNTKNKKLLYIKENNRNPNKRNSGKVPDCSNLLIPTFTYSNASCIKRQKTTKKTTRKISRRLTTMKNYKIN